jgi:glutamate formiminotransferase/formiminotetrahydrofolate cyclodeaminase
MNLTNFRATPVARVVEMIRREAARYGVGIHHSELVGLIPQEALVDAAIWHLQLDQFEPEQILEQRMAAALQRSAQAQTASETPPGASPSEEGGQAGFGRFQFLDALASGTPAPGGGSASAYSAAARPPWSRWWRA